MRLPKLCRLPLLDEPAHLASHCLWQRVNLQLGRWGHLLQGEEWPVVEGGRVVVVAAARTMCDLRELHELADWRRSLRDLELADWRTERYWHRNRWHRRRVTGEHGLWAGH